MILFVHNSLILKKKDGLSLKVGIDSENTLIPLCSPYHHGISPSRYASLVTIVWGHLPSLVGGHCKRQRSFP